MRGLSRQHGGSAGSAVPGLTPGAFFKANPSQPTADTAKPMAAMPLGSRQRLTAKLGLASQSTTGKRPAAAAKHQAVVCKQGQSGAVTVHTQLHMRA